MYLYRLYTNIYIYNNTYKHKKMLHKLYYSIYCIQYLILHVTTVTSLHRNNTHRLHNLQQYYTFTHSLTLLMK